MRLSNQLWRHPLWIWMTVLCLHLTLLGDEPNFGPREMRGIIAHDALTEISGIAASRKNPDILWVHNDSGDANRLFAMDTEGRHRGIFHLEGATNRDWEDICVGPGPDSLSYIYIGDIGDNAAIYPEKVIYRVAEPLVPPDGPPVDTLLTGVDAIRFRLPDGIRDTESLMIDPETRDIYIISKRELNVRVYRLPYPQPTDSTVTAEVLGTLPFSYASAADISSDGREILIKTYAHIFYWCRPPGGTIADILQQPGIPVSYVAEPQGEAVCWNTTGSGYFTTSEEPANIPAVLAYYPRLPSSISPAETPAVTFLLAQNYPNPFNPRTEIHFELQTADSVSLRIYDAAGRLVTTLLNQRMPAGTHRVGWDGTDASRQAVASGTYFYRLRVGVHSQTRKMILVR